MSVASGVRPARHRSVALISTAILVSISAAGLTRGVTPSHATSGGFTVSGNQILDPNGTVFVPRGVNIVGYDSFYTLASGPGLGYAPYVTAASIAAMRQQWGVNTVRILVSEPFWLNPGNCSFYANYRSDVTNLVNLVAGQGMLAVVDLHTNTRGTPPPCLANYVPTRIEMADRTYSEQYWQSVASTFSSNRYVAFDLFNEPQGPPGSPGLLLGPSEWLSGGPITDSTGTWNADGMQTLYNAVRGTGATNLVFVSADGIAQQLHGVFGTVSGNNIVYAVHAYHNNMDCVPPPGNYPPEANHDAAFQPVVVTEFGCPTASKAAAYNGQVIANAEHPSPLVGSAMGWVAFAWTKQDLTPNSPPNYGLLADSTSFNPGNGGVPVYAALHGG